MCNHFVYYPEFNKIIGNDKAEILNKSIESFDEFLRINYNNQTNQNHRIIEFLKTIQKNEYCPDENWIFSTESNKQIIEQFEKSGLRKEIWMYGFERRERKKEYQEYYDNYRDIAFSTTKSLGSLKDLNIEDEIFPLTNDSLFMESLKQDDIRFDSTKIATEISNIIIALDKIKPTDSLLINYIETKLIAGSISPSLLINILLYNYERHNFDNPLIKVILVTEFYYGIMNWDLERNIIK